MKVKSRPFVNLSSESIEIFRREAFDQNKPLSQYLADLLILGHQKQNYSNN